jgi:hypothetical protein
LSELNNIINGKDYWYKLLSIRIKMTIDEEAKYKTNKIFKEEKKKKLLEEKKNQKNESNKNSPNETSNNDKRRYSAVANKSKKLFGFGLSDVVGNLFGRENSASLEEKEKKEKEDKRRKEIFIEVCNKISSEVAMRLIKDFIVHFSCFCVESYDVIDIITELTSRYKIVGEEKQIKFFMSIFNSNMYSIKNTKFKIISKDLNNTKNDSKFMNKNYLQGNANKNNKSLILLNIMKYLPYSDYINILLVNKATYNLIINILYSNLLTNIEEDIPKEIEKKNPIPNVWKHPELRLKIWKILLHFKNDIDYKQLVESIKKKENKQECIAAAREIL